jgi:predicted O-methyltransferase YrrM
LFFCSVKILFEYTKFILKAKGRHGIHSPFIYQLVDQCFKLKPNKDFRNKRSQLFKELLQDKTLITINDQGAGSKKLSNTRTIRQIFKTSSSKGKYANLLYQLSEFYQPKSILEFGTSLGIGSIHLASGNPLSKLITVEACSETRTIAIKNFEKLNISNIQTIHQTFMEYIQSLNEECFDLVYIDGHHSGEALIAYLNLLKPYTHNNTLFVLDDIRWDESMLKAWKSICNSDEYHVTIDLFRMGLITPRKEQEKEHFILKL